MDNIRFVLIIVFAMLSLMLWQAWQIDYGPKPAVVVSEQPVIDTKTDLPAEGGSPTAAVQSNAPAPTAQASQSQLVTVKTDVYEIAIDTLGGTLVKLDLLNYPVEKKNTAVNTVRKLFGMSETEQNLNPIRLFDTKNEQLFLAQSGLIPNSDSVAVADHHSNFNAPQTQYALAEGQDSIVVPLSWTNNEGLTVTKVFTFKRGSYTIDVQQKITNQSAKPWNGRQYSQFLRVPYKDPAGNSFIRTYTGAVVYTEEDKYKKVDYAEMAEEDLNVGTKGGWVAMIQHYFGAAWIPQAEQENHMYSKSLGDEKYVIGSYSPVITVAPSAEQQLQTQLFAGPKIQTMQEKIAKGLELTVDYGRITFIAKPIYSLLNFIHEFLGNWGFSILGVTFVIKLLFFPLSAASYKSMAKMRKIQPRLKEMQERYADNRQLFNQKMMALYKEEKVNPLGGCLPIMVQIPVFISLYWVLVETVELRQAPFALWIQDLSAQDPYFLLPILMGITMKIQQSLNPPPIDPIQAKIMRMFPIVFTFFFLFFPAGLVLYWVMNNTLSILQQWYITNKIVKEHH